MEILKFNEMFNFKLNTMELINDYILEFKFYDVDTFVSYSILQHGLSYEGDVLDPNLVYNEIYSIDILTPEVFEDEKEYDNIIVNRNMKIIKIVKEIISNLSRELSNIKVSQSIVDGHEDLMQYGTTIYVESIVPMSKEDIIKHNNNNNNNENN